MESNLKSFLQLKNHKDCKDLDIEVITFILESFENSEGKKQKKYNFNNNNYKKSNQILKNPKIKLIKEKISNKVNLILNKLSENNLSSLLIEFFQNIKIVNLDDFNEVIKTIYIKMLTEIKFLKLYLEFFKNIIGTYKHVYSYNISYFYDLLEYKFNFDYNNLEDINMDFLKDYDAELNALEAKPEVKPEPKKKEQKEEDYNPLAASLTPEQINQGKKNKEGCVGVGKKKKEV
jgi:hypothetical protein